VFRLFKPFSGAKSITQNAFRRFTPPLGAKKKKEKKKRKLENMTLIRVNFLRVA
jgi:hypothetical protein